MTLPANGGNRRKPCSACWDRIGGQMRRAVATALVGLLVDQRVWRDGASPAEVGPPLPQNFGDPPDAAPYYAYGGPYYGAYAYGGVCVMRRRPVINRWGHRVWRWVRVCY